MLSCFQKWFPPNAPRSTERQIFYNTPMHCSWISGSAMPFWIHILLFIKYCTFFPLLSPGGCGHFADSVNFTFKMRYSKYGCCMEIQPSCADSVTLKRYLSENDLNQQRSQHVLQIKRRNTSKTTQTRVFRSDAPERCTHALRLWFWSLHGRDGTKPANLTVTARL